LDRLLDPLTSRSRPAIPLGHRSTGHQGGPRVSGGHERPLRL